MNEDIKAMAGREKIWPERSLEEKIAALHRQVVFLTQRANAVSQTIEPLIEHSHGEHGQVLVPLARQFGLSNSVAAYDHRGGIPMALRERV